MSLNQGKRLFFPSKNDPGGIHGATRRAQPEGPDSVRPRLHAAIACWQLPATKDLKGFPKISFVFFVSFVVFMECLCRYACCLWSGADDAILLTRLRQG